MDTSTEIFWKLSKFCLVGFLGLLVDFGLTFFLKEKLRINKYLSNSIGFLAAASCNYFLNRIWTFESSNPAVIIEYSKFMGISIIGLIINNGFLWLFHQKLGLSFYLSKLVAIIVTTLWNFTANYLFTF